MSHFVGSSHCVSVSRCVLPQVSDLQLDLKETNAEWEVKLQVLRQDVAAAHGQLQRALVSATAAAGKRALE